MRQSGNKIPLHFSSTSPILMS